MFIKENIKKYRKLANLTQAQLAELSGISTSTIAKIEAANSTPGNYRLDTVARIAAVLNVRIKDIFEFADVLDGNPYDLMDPADEREFIDRGLGRTTWNPLVGFTSAGPDETEPREFRLVFKKRADLDETLQCIVEDTFVYNKEKTAVIGNLRPIVPHGKLVDADALKALYRHRALLLQTEEAINEYHAIEAALELAPVILSATGTKK